jgi:hypothetical protein
MTKQNQTILKKTFFGGKMLLNQIRQSGFTVELDGNSSFSVSPPNKITDKQREFLKANKAVIMRELLLETTVYTLWGKAITLNATDVEHQKWLIEINHKSSTPSHLTTELSND